MFFGGGFHHILGEISPHLAPNLFIASGLPETEPSERSSAANCC